MSLISFYMKSLGQRSAGKPHAALDVAGAGNVLIWSGAPVLDPTDERRLKSEWVIGSADLPPRQASTLPFSEELSSITIVDVHRNV